MATDHGARGSNSSNNFRSACPSGRAQFPPPSSTLLRSVLVEVLAQMLDLQLGQLAGRKTRAGIFVATLTAHEHPGPLVVVTSDGKFLVKPFELARDDAVHWRPPSKVVQIGGLARMTIR